MTQRRVILRILVLVAGAILLFGGVACGILYVFLPFIYDGPDLVAANVTVASVAALTLGLGIALSYQALNSLKGRPSGVFRPPSPWLLVVLFVPFLIVGQAMVSLLDFPVFTSLAFPPLHVLAAIAPALVILALVGRRTGAGSWRTVSLEVSHGALLAPTGALAIEIFILFVLALVVSFIVFLAPGGVDRLMELYQNLQDPTWLEDPTNVAQLVLSPSVLTLIIVVFAIIAPLVEEFLKGLGVLLLGYRLRGGAEALLWGVACGAGFALAESLFNGSMALEGWAVVMLLRWGATLMHCVGSGIMGLGWHEAIVNRRPWRFLGAYGASAGVHALWNGAAIGVGIPSLLMLTRPEDVLAQGLAGLIVLGFMAFLLLLIILMVLVLFYLTRRASRLSSGAVAFDERDRFPGEFS